MLSAEMRAQANIKRGVFFIVSLNLGEGSIGVEAEESTILNVHYRGNYVVLQLEPVWKWRVFC